MVEKLAQELADQRHCSSAETDIHDNYTSVSTVLKLVHCP